MKSILKEQNHWYFLLGGAFAVLLATPFLANAVVTASLDIGSTGAEVTEVQTFLAAQPTLYPEGLVTGYYGTLTATAVQRYQCQKGIVCSGSAAATGYGRVGPQTRAAINFDLGGAAPGTGGSANDVFAPVMTAAAVNVSATSSAPASATISWGTNEAARSRVMYSTVWPFLYAAAPSVVDATVDTSTSITLTNLAPSTTYFHVRESVDASGNVMWSTATTFRTNP